MLKQDGKATSHNIFEDSQLLVLSEAPVKLVFNGDMEKFMKIHDEYQRWGNSVSGDRAFSFFGQGWTAWRSWIRRRSES